MTLDATSFKPGQDILCTVAKLPKAQASVTTIERLMRLDPDNKRALRRAQRMRSQRELVYNRGNRDWVSREKPARVVRCVSGATWTMPFTVDLADELASVSKYVTVKAK